MNEIVADIEKFTFMGFTFDQHLQLHQACFQHDMAYEDFKDLARRTASGKVLRDTTISIAKNPKYDGYQRGPASMVYNFFHKKHKVVVLIMRLNKMNYQPKNYTNQLLEKKF